MKCHIRAALNFAIINQRESCVLFGCEKVNHQQKEAASLLVILHFHLNVMKITPWADTFIINRAPEEMLLKN